jgi:HEAT repeat protein
MNVITLALHISTLFTILSVILILAIIGLHFAVRRRSLRRDAFLADALPVVKSYLAGSTTLAEVVEHLRKDRSDALGLLIRLSETATPEETRQLQAILSAFPFVQNELAALKSRRVAVRLKNAQILGYLRDPSAIPPLLDALEDDAFSVRIAAAQSLARLGHTETVLPILHALNVPGEVPIRRVAEVLFDFGPAATEPMLHVLEAPETPFSQLTIAVRVCGMLGEERAVPRLIELLQHESMPVRLNSVRSLAAIGDASAVPAISALAEDPSWEVRNAVMQALGTMKACDHIPILISGLADSEWWVRYSAAQALYKLGPNGIQNLKSAAALSLDRFSRDISNQVLQEHQLHESPTHP